MDQYLYISSALCSLSLAALAYKKYFARVSKGKMSKPDFEVWAREAERMRDDALAEDELARDKAAHEQIVRRLTEELNRT